MADAKICSIPGCGNMHVARGWCENHYRRWLRNADPLGGRTPPGEPLQWIVDHTSYKGDDCLIWPYNTRENGYGSVTYKGKQVTATRVMLTIAIGEPPTPEYEAAHNCGKGHTGCINPKHLRWDTKEGNFADCLAHGTRRRGESIPWSKLTELDVRYIRKMDGIISGREIAKVFGVSPSAICNIVKRKSWSWVED